MVFVALPENGFTSKILSCSSTKKKAFVPATPTKKSVKRVCGRSMESKRNLAARFGLEDCPFSSLKSSLEDEEDLTEARVLLFSEDPAGQMVVKTRPVAPGRLQTEFEVLGRLGEGTFGEAFRVRRRSDGQSFAVKRAKEAYTGYRDREARLQEVWRAMRV